MLVLKRLIPWLFLLYFVILFAERIQSLIRINLDNSYIISFTPFDRYINFILMASLIGMVVLLLFFNNDFFKSLFSETTEPNFYILTATAGVLLLSGMVHTKYTITSLQFVSYGMLILAMIFNTIISVNEGAPALPAWFTLIYLTVFSMAIPVVYQSNIEKASLFHIIEIVVSLLLVVVFTLMLQKFFTGNSTNLLYWIPIIIVAIGNFLIIYLRWNEEVNTFLLIFASLSVVLFIVGKLIPSFHK